MNTTGTGSLSRADRLFVSALGSGFSPFASGTVGSAAALVPYVMLLYLAPGVLTWPAILIASVVVFIPAVPASTRAERVYGEDPSVVVIDEVVGMWLTLVSPLIPAGLLYAVLGFFLFRLFDIVKPWPARLFDRRPGGFGIMMDDVVAAVYANLCAHILLYGLVLSPVVLRFLSGR